MAASHIMSTKFEVPYGRPGSKGSGSSVALDALSIMLSKPYFEAKNLYIIFITGLLFQPSYHEACKMLQFIINTVRNYAIENHNINCTCFIPLIIHLNRRLHANQTSPKGLNRLLNFAQIDSVHQTILIIQS